MLTRARRCSRCSRVGSGGLGLPPALPSGSRAPVSNAWWMSRSRSKRNSHLVALCGVPQEACELPATCTGWDGVSRGRGSRAGQLPAHNCRPSSRVKEPASSLHACLMVLQALCTKMASLRLLATGPGCGRDLDLAERIGWRKEDECLTWV